MGKTTQAQIASLKAIPREKWPSKIGRMLIAAGIIIMLIWLGPKKGGNCAAPWWALMGGGLVAGVVASGELMLAPVKLAGAAIVDFVARLHRAERGES